MKNGMFIIFLLLLIFNVSCSVNQNEVTDIDEEVSSLEVEADDDELELEGLTDGEEEVASTSEEYDEVEMVDEEVATTTNSENTTIVEPLKMTTEVEEYQVKKNETLMMIAFKLYGDYSKWRELAKLNNTTNVTEGMIIKYSEPQEQFAWNPKGNPYLIKGGDTLGTISGSVYGTPKKWKFIWDNNKPLIKNPNLIFAGFTIYWLDEKDVASR